MSSTDQDTEDQSTFTYTIVAGAGDTDNASFAVSGRNLVTADGVALNYETKDTYLVRVRTTDASAGTFEQALTISISDVNEAPTDITLSSSTIAEDQSSGTTIGTFDPADVDQDENSGGTNADNNTYTYSLVAGTGDTDNGSFSISGATIKTGIALDFETKDSYDVRVNVNDGSNDFEKAFTISISDANDAPTALSIGSTTINENSAAGSTIGQMSSTDQDTTDQSTFTYTIVAGTGDTDNASFAISGRNLVTAVGVALNYETKDTYLVRVRTTDASAGTFEQALTISVSDVNEAPTDIALSSSTIAEDQPSGTTIGTFDPADVDQDENSGGTNEDNNTYTYSLVAGTGDTDNGSFSISGATIKTGIALDFETKDSYDVRVNVNDGSNDFEKAFTISISDVNDAPTALSIGSTTINENSAAGSTIGQMSSTDQDTTDQSTFTYTIVAGTGDTDNASFAISGRNLVTAVGVALNYETKDTYLVRVRTTDASAGTFEQALTISVSDVNEAPTDIALSSSTIAEDQPSGTTIGTFDPADVDQDENSGGTNEDNNTYTYSLVAGTGDTDNGSFSISGATIKTGIALDFETKDSYDVRVNVNDGSNDFEKAFTISISDVNDAPTALSIGSTTINENSAAGSTIGQMSSTDQDTTDQSTFTYTIVAGTGDTDNASFAISGRNLVTAVGVALNYETKDTYLVRVRTTDASAGTFEQALTISVSDVNEAPTDIALSSSTIAEDQPSGTTIGTFDPADVDQTKTAVVQIQIIIHTRIH